jgi:hypothetical protein
MYVFKGKGHHPNIVFEVKCQRNNGPLLSTDHFRLENGRVLPVVGGNFTQKKHAFKNFKCLVHDLFYAVDVYNNSSTASGGYNFHHMRLNPYTRINPATLDEFFRDWSSSSSSLSSSSAPSSSSLLSSTEHTTDDDDHSS